MPSLGSTKRSETTSPARYLLGSHSQKRPPCPMTRSGPRRFPSESSTYAPDCPGNDTRSYFLFSTLSIVLLTEPSREKAARDRDPPAHCAIAQNSTRVHSDLRHISGTR